MSGLVFVVSIEHLYADEACVEVFEGTARAVRAQLLLHYAEFFERVPAGDVHDVIEELSRLQIFDLKVSFTQREHA